MEYEIAVESVTGVDCVEAKSGKGIKQIGRAMEKLRGASTSYEKRCLDCSNRWENIAFLQRPLQDLCASCRRYFD